MQARAQSPFGDIDELGNLRVTQPLNIAEVDDLLMGRGELADGVREFFA